MSGEVREIKAPVRIAFTYVMAGGVASLVTVALEKTEQGTLLSLRHAFSSGKIRDAFVQGWRYQLALLSKAVSEERRAETVERVDAFLRAWGEPDAKTRGELLESCAAPGIVFRDAYGATAGLEDLLANLEAIQVFMPGVTLARAGDVRLSHGSALAAWTAKKAAGDLLGTGASVFDFSPDGRVVRVIGFWDK